MRVRQIYIAAALLVMVGCGSSAGKVFSPQAIYEDKGSLLVTSTHSGSIARISEDGQLICSSPNLGVGVNDLEIVGDKIWAVAGDASGEIIELERESLQPINRQNIGHTPSDIVVDSKRGLIWVLLRHQGKLVAIDNSTFEDKHTIDVGREPSTMVLFDGGDKLLIGGNLPEQAATSFPISSLLRIVDLSQGKVQQIISLPNGSTDLKAITTDRDGRYGYITHLIARYQLPTNQVDRGWMSTNAMSIIDLKDRKLLSSVLLDTPQRGAANPWAVEVSDDNRQLFVALSGSHQVAVIDRDLLHKRLDSYYEGKPTSHSSRDVSQIVNDASFLYGIRYFVDSNGKGTRDIAQIGDRLYASNYFTGDINYINTKELVANSTMTNLYSSPNSLMQSAKGRGEMAFHDATLCFQQWQSCASCHPNDARTDGVNWDLMNDGVANPKSTKSMLFAHQSAPAMVTGIRADAQTAVRSGFKHIFFAKVNPKVASEVDQYLSSLDAQQSPYTLAGDQLSPQAMRGEQIFAKECAACHSGNLYTNQKQYPISWSTSTESGRKMDVPTLREVWRTAPYLYDGRAYTMQEALSVHSNLDSYTEQQKEDLALYVLSL